ncbi:MAG: hypothetical protein ACI915_002287 [Gammaproteobacteria bacterium]|jgi:hypothetical protein
MRISKTKDVASRLRGSLLRRLTASSLCIALMVLFATHVQAVGPPEGVVIPSSSGYGLSTVKRAGCMSCHKWHGDGGPGYGGAAISLRKTLLNREQLIQTIACGRPGRGMPYFDRKAYKTDMCYGMTFENFADQPDRAPMKGKKYLNDRQVNAVADFIIEELQGKEITKEYCELFYGGATRQCEDLNSEK